MNRVWKLFLSAMMLFHFSTAAVSAREPEPEGTEPQETVLPEREEIDEEAKEPAEETPSEAEQSEPEPAGEESGIIDEELPSEESRGFCEETEPEEETGGSGEEDSTVLEDSPGLYKRTIMLYLDGCDLETNTGNATRNLLQMLNASFSRDQEICLLVLTGGAAAAGKDTGGQYRRSHQHSVLDDNVRRLSSVHCPFLDGAAEGGKISHRCFPGMHAGVSPSALDKETEEGGGKVKTVWDSVCEEE